LKQIREFRIQIDKARYVRALGGDALVLRARPLESGPYQLLSQAPAAEAGRHEGMSENQRVPDQRMFDNRELTLDGNFVSRHGGIVVNLGRSEHGLARQGSSERKKP
jgi:hypothetical protein